MNVLLLRPPASFSTTSSTSHVCPPLGLAYIAAAARAAGHAATCIDACGEAPFQQTPDVGGTVRVGLSTTEIIERIARTSPDVIGISVLFSQDWPLARETATAIKAAFPQVVMVSGGEHVSALPELCLEQCGALDICVVGEGEATFVAVLSALAHGHPLAGVDGIVYRTATGTRRTSARPRLNVDKLPRPAWDLLPIDAYLKHGLSYGVNRGRTMPLLASRGCPYSCTFCSSPSMWTTKWTVRPVEDVMAEIADLMQRHGAECFDFYDLTTIVRRDWILEFCQAIEDRGWKISWQMPAGTRAEALDREVLDAMYRSGNRYVVYAPESGSEATLKAINKRVHLDRMTESIRHAVAIGMSVKLNAIMGLPNETARDLWATMRYLTRMACLGVEDTFVACFTPYPGSALFASMRDEGRLPPLDDAYFRSLGAITSLTQSRASSPRLSDQTITFFRVTSMLLFYGITFVRRPSRLLRLARNVWRNREESRLELGLVDMKARLLGRSA